MKDITNYHSVTTRYENSLAARERFEELTLRDLMARAQANLQARGEFDPAKHGDPTKYLPLTLDERLEVLAVGEFLARTYRWSGYVHNALNAGATWQQIAEALDRHQDEIRILYRDWIDGQHRLWVDCEGRVGMSDDEYEIALRRCSE